MSNVPIPHFLVYMEKDLQISPTMITECEIKILAESRDRYKLQSYLHGGCRVWCIVGAECVVVCRVSGSVQSDIVFSEIVFSAE